jgi:shikimate kinase
VEEEGKALLHFERQGHVVSLTGSNPMYPAAMDHISKTGIVVFLDVKNEDITERLLNELTHTLNVKQLD